MINAYNIKALKKATSLTINSDLLQKAKEYKINLSKALEERLEELVREYEREKWLKESKSAIDEYNKKVEQSGVFSDTLRRF